MIDCAPVRTAIRRERKHGRLGASAKVCLRCGYADPASLIPVSAAWIRSHKETLPHTLFQNDHGVGRNHDPRYMNAICRNCHGEVTELRRLAGITMRFQPDRELREILRLEALALLFKDTGSALERWASEKRTTKEKNNGKNTSNHLARPHGKRERQKTIKAREKGKTGS